MGLRLFASVVGLALLSHAAVRAQDPLLHPPPRATTPAIYPADGLLPAEKPAEVVEAGKWRSDVIFGLPIALRVQRRLWDSPLFAEGGVALYGPIPSVFAGLRYDGRFHEGQRNCWYTRPGCDVYYSPVRGNETWISSKFNSMAAIAIDNEIAWQRKWSQGFHSHLSLKAGFGVAVAGRNVVPLPILGVTCGLQY